MTTTEDLQRMAEEPLDPELEPWVEEDGPFGRTLKHPLVFDLLLTMPGLCNRALRQKRQLLKKAIADEDWHSVVFLHERPYRTVALVERVVGRDDDGRVFPLRDEPAEIKDLAASVWTDSENLHQNVAEWAEMFADPDGLVIGSSEEMEAFQALPDPLTIYRADIEDGGWSWTTDRSVAEWFAKRFDANAPVIRRTVRKSAVFGYLTRRGEYEILVPIEEVE